MPHPGKQWAERGGKHKDPDREPRRRRRATYHRHGGVRHLFAACANCTLDGTDHADHTKQGNMIRGYIIWRNRHADDRRLRTVVDRANVA
ncbi:hypothetical protein ADK74_20715 [Streptomyces decoyicus]|nr:hypothetical protein [Streptomyces decoyicus]KOG41416.1 hypothetical protein ADK74_20715 [Streptomyces decoyicus]QZY19901.1 hypothetical protein K7C20_35625 [Streptomyces decoyicus]